MTKVFIADTLDDERMALRLLVADLHWQLVGESSDWISTLTLLHACSTDILLVNRNLLVSAPAKAIERLRKLCRTPVVVILLGQLEADHQEELPGQVDVFIDRSETYEIAASEFYRAAELVKSTLQS